MKTIFLKHVDGDVLALFPGEPYSTPHPDLCMSYQTVSQHGGTSIHLLEDNPEWRRATEGEATELITELSRLGYDIDAEFPVNPDEVAKKKQQLSDRIDRARATLGDLKSEVIAANDLGELGRLEMELNEFETV